MTLEVGSQANRKMKKGALLPNAEHVVRHVPFAKTRRDSSGKILGILPTAIERRDGEDYLSVSHLEHFSGDADEQLKQVKSAIAAGKKTGSLGANGLLAKANVGQIKVAVQQRASSKIRIAYLPTKADPSHSGVYEIPQDDAELMAELTDDVFAETVLVGNI